MFKLLLGLLVVLAAFTAASPTPASSCVTSGYTYAGLEGWDGSHGVAATVSVVGVPMVAAGHVAGWIGIGGYGAGPGGSDVWLQAGVSALPGGRPHVYYEFKSAGADRKYVQVGGVVRSGEPRRLALREIAGRPTWWRVWVDGRAITPALHLSGRRAWMPTATAESWDGGTGSCNMYSFRFDRVRVAKVAGGRWQAWSHASTFSDGGSVVRRVGRGGFLAAALQPEGDHELAALPVSRSR
jgi:hypothetical protein